MKLVNYIDEYRCQDIYSEKTLYSKRARFYGLDVTPTQFVLLYLVYKYGLVLHNVCEDSYGSLFGKYIIWSEFGDRFKLSSDCENILIGVLQEVGE